VAMHPTLGRSRRRRAPFTRRWLWLRPVMTRSLPRAWSTQSTRCAPRRVHCGAMSWSCGAGTLRPLRRCQLRASRFRPGAAGRQWFAPRVAGSFVGS